jgi:hypothetical protein
VPTERRRAESWSAYIAAVTWWYIPVFAGLLFVVGTTQNLLEGAIVIAVNFIGYYEGRYRPDPPKRDA